MELNKLLLVLPLFLLTLIKESSCIKCHDCWTKDEDHCGYGDRLGEPDDCGYKDNVCKKVVTNAYSIVKKGRNSYYELMSNVTSRLCGKSHWTGCKKTYGAASETIECACDIDGCNTAPSLLLYCSFLPIATAILVPLAARIVL